MFTRIKRKLGYRRRLQPTHRALGTPTSLVINEISHCLGLAKNYLEVGVEYGYTFEAVVAKHKTAVDPKMRFRKWPPYSGITIQEMNSDSFFGTLSKNMDFDLVFLDGLHTSSQTWKDLVNVSKHLHTKSIVVIDDTVPNDEFSVELSSQLAYQKRELAGIGNDYRWHGDVYRVILNLVENYPGIEIATIIDVPNPFTVCWNIPINLGEYTETLPNKTYTQVFDNGVPDYFNPKGRKDLIKQLEHLYA